MRLHDLLTFSGIAAFISVLGNLVALYLKDFIGARSFERWKARQALLAVYDRYRRPICLAAEELGGRCYSIAVTRSGGSRKNVGMGLLGLVGEMAPNKAYLKYRFLSDAYRLCSFLGWIELYRRDRGLLDAGAERKNHELDNCIERIRNDLAEERLVKKENRGEWNDYLIFREQQRTIGFRMIEDHASNRIIDFGTFSDIIEDNSDKEKKGKWFVLAAHFFSNLDYETDFRIVRMKLLIVHLTELRALLDPDNLRVDHIESAKKLRDQLIDSGYHKGLKE